MADNELEMHEIMDVSIPLTDEELEIAAGDSTVYVFDDGGAKNKKRKKMLYMCAIGTLTLLFIAVIILAGELLHEKRSEHSPAPPPIPPISDVPDVKDQVWKDLRESMREAIDPAAHPCESFYDYACGGWVKANQDLDPSRPSLSRSFSKIADENDVILRNIMEDGWPIISPLYRSCMDQDALDALGISPLTPWKERIYREDNEDLAQLVSELHKVGFSGLFSFGVGADFHAPDRQVMEVDQGGLGLPGRKYYLNNDTDTVQLRSYYRDFMGRVLGRVLSTSPAALLSSGGRVDAVLAIEHALAQASMAIADRRNPEMLYHMSTRSALNSLVPSFDFLAYIQAMGIPSGADQINVVDPDFFEALEQLLSSTPRAAIQDYLVWHVVLGSGSLLDTQMQDEFFHFSAQFTGRTQRQPRWKECTGKVNGLLGMLVGRYFVLEHFSGNSKELANTLLDTIKQSFGAHLPQVPWMDGETRRAALDKLHAMGQKIGYPDVWEDFDALVIAPGKWFDSVRDIYEYWNELEMGEAGGETDKNEWGMYPQTVNAQYSPLRNEMLFPAAILQPPFFHKDFPVAVNWGGMGVVMGHELSHGFDDEGRQFDKDGKLVQWWTDESIAGFEEHAQCVVDLYDGFEVSPTLPPVHGDQTEGENLADTSGLSSSFRALQELKNHPDYAADIKHSEKYFGMSAEQLFFLSYGQVWCSVSTDKRAAFLIENDVHSPGKARVNLPTSQMDEFSKAFDCPVGSPMNPPQKCAVW
eukprot:TRINITY_DN4863_c0_g1_i1.p1 TRINITY_DN4863_c0_g1~~TRINITY_DN4863_c0_g1_i1.p1  ORF type:complete len:754 (+),score=259.49 TRINITY_DN4863_c0_g1_i1:107-2368(+)